MKKLLLLVLVCSVFIISCEKNNITPEKQEDYQTKSIRPYFFGFYGDTKLLFPNPTTGEPDTTNFNAGDTIKIAFRITSNNIRVAFNKINIKIINDTMRYQPKPFSGALHNSNNFRDMFGIVAADYSLPFNLQGTADYSIIKLSSSTASAMPQDYILIYKLIVPPSYKGKDYNFYISVDENTEYNSSTWFFIHRLFRVKP